MMTVSLREAHSSKHPISLAAVRSTFLLLILATLALCGAPSALAQGLSPNNAIQFGDVNLGTTGGFSQQFIGPAGGVSVQGVTAVTYGASGEDFSVVSSTCTGTITYPNTCTVDLAFTPKQIGLRLGALLITNTSNVVINTIYLSGVGIAPQFVFSPATAVPVDTASTLAPTSFTAGAVTQDGLGNVFFTDVLHGRVLERSATGVYSDLFSLPVSNTSGIAIDGAGNLFVSSGNSVYTVALSSTPPYTPKPLVISNVTLTTPTGLAVDLIGDLYIADSTNNKIYQLPPGATTATTLTFTGPGATLSGPTDLTVASTSTIYPSSNLYIADSGNNRILENSLGSTTTTDVTPATITPSNPTGIAVDAAGTLYIADTGHHQIIEATASGNQFVLTTNNVPAFSLDAPAGVLIEGNGDLLVSDTTLGLVTFVRTTASINFPTPTEVGTIDTTPGEYPETLTVQGTGNIVSSLNANDPSFTGTNPTAFLIAPTGSTCPTAAPGSFTIGEVCTYDLNFQPTVVGPNLANLVLTTSAPGVPSSTNSATLTGIGVTTLKYFTLVAISVPPTTPTAVSINGSVELVLTAYNSNNTVAKDYSGNITFTTTDANGLYQGGTAPGTNTSVYTMTTADNGVLTIPVASGLQLNQYGIWTATAVADPATVPSGANGTALSNQIFVIEPATLKLTSSINPTAVNQSTTFTLTITATGPTPITPTGTVTFYSNGVQIGTGPVTVTGTGAVATASIPDSFATPGSYPITATYTPTSFTQGGTASLTQVVGNATSLALTSSINPSLVGQSTNLTATITYLPVFGAPTGTVQFFDGATSLGTVAVSGSTATLPVSFATAGNHTLTAVYTSTNPDLTNATSGPCIQHVLNLASLILTSSVNPSTPGQSTTLTATLSTLTTTPGGTIKFYDGTTLVGTVTLPTNSVSVSFTTPGNHILTAVYSGDATTETINSPPLTQVVLYVTTATLTSSVNPVNVNANTTLSATVHSTTGTPTGTVTFKSNGITIGTGTLSGGVATLITSFNLPGTYTLVATYGGDANNQPATTNTVVETVINVVSIGLTSSVNPVFLDNAAVLTATLTTAAGTTPTGTVNFLDGTTPIGSGTIVNGMASITASFVYAGPHSLTAVYAGDAQDAPATSPVFTQTVADFSLGIASGGSSSASIIAAGSATYNLVVTPLITSTLPGPLTLTVTGLPTTVTGTLTPTTIATGSGTTPVAFAVTAASLLQVGHLQRPPAHHSPRSYAPVALAVLALPLAWFRRRQRFASLFASILLLLAVTAGISGCAGPANTGYYGETPQTYNLTVTATSGNLSRSTYLTLTVQ